jgi:hypothetical protein
MTESRAMTISIDFDRTFAADPQLWGQFAAKSVADGNTVVMISRRPDTPEDRQTVTETLGQYAPAFSQVLLVGSETLKADAAQAAGINVDVWVDDSPQFIRSVDRRAEPGSVAEGEWVTFGDGRIGVVDHVMTEGVLNQGDIEVPASPEAPVMLVSVWVDGDFAGQEAVMVADATKIEQPEDARGYKTKKPRKRSKPK